MTTAPMPVVDLLDEELRKRGVDVAKLTSAMSAAPAATGAPAVNLAATPPASPYAGANAQPTAPAVNLTKPAAPTMTGAPAGTPPAVDLTGGRVQPSIQNAAEPTRAEYQPKKMPVWEKLAGAAGFGLLEGIPGAQKFLASPQAKADQQFQRDDADWKEGQVQAATDLNRRKEEASIEDTQSQSALRKSQAAAADRKDETTLALHGFKRDDTGGIIPDEDSPIYQQQQQKLKDAEGLDKLRNAQTDLASARAAVERAKNDPNSPAYKTAQQKLQMAQRAHDIAAQNLGLHQAEFENKLQEQDLVKPSGQSQSRGSAAKAVLDLMPGLEAQVRKNAANMGPLMGRLYRGEIAIGNVPPDVAELYSAMKSFYALQPAVHGFRNAEFVKDFETALGTLERDPEAFISGMKGLKPTLESVYNEGRTFHKRIVDGKPDSGVGGKTWNPKTGRYE